MLREYFSYNERLEIFLTFLQYSVLCGSYRLFQIPIPGLSFHLSVSSLALGVRRAACVSSLLHLLPLGRLRVPLCVNSINRLVLEVTSNEVVATSLCAPLKNRKIPSFLSLSHACPQSPVCHSAFWITLSLFCDYLSPLTFPNLSFSRSLHRQVCSSFRHFANRKNSIFRYKRPKRAVGAPQV